MEYLFFTLLKGLDFYLGCIFII